MLKRTGRLKRTPLRRKPKSREKIDDEKKERELMWTVFLSIWKKRIHKSEVSGTPIYGECLSTYMHHILPKEDNQYPEFKLLEENIIILLAEEHDGVEKNMYLYEEINTRRLKLLEKWENLMSQEDS